jgi:hypothetical protein
MVTKDKSFRFSLDAEEYQILEDYARAQGLSMAGILRQYIRSLKEKERKEAK